MDFLKRHKRKAFVTVGIAASAYMVTGWVKSKFFELQDRILTERLAKENLEKRFEQNQKDATFTILALLPSLGNNVITKYDVEAIRQQLQALRTPKDLSDSTSSELAGSAIQDPSGAAQQAQKATDQSTQQQASKVELWNRIKIESITRALTIIYADALLVLLTRVQLNLLGRYTYISSVKEFSGSPVLSLEDSEHLDHVNRQYLTFSWWLLNKGWDTLSQRVQAAVELATEQIDPRSELTLEQVNELLGNIQFNVEHPRDLEGPSFLANVLPPRELETYVLSQAPGTVVAPETVDGQLREMLNETADLLESPNAAQVVHNLVHVGISVFVNKLKPMFPQEDSTTKLASILVVSTKQAHQMAVGHPLGNDYVDAMVENPELDAFCAVIYTNF